MRCKYKLLLLGVTLGTTGCLSEKGKLEVRAIRDPLTAATKAGSPLIDQARSMLALGNAGLALEAFRKAQREQPDSIEAIAGIAACYDQMGRYDLSRSYFEAALAIAPTNPILLNTFAASLERRGSIAEARKLRAEAALAAPSSAGASTAVAAAIATQTPPLAAAQASGSGPATVLDAPEPYGTVEWAISGPALHSVTVSLPPVRPLDTLSHKNVAAEDIRIDASMAEHGGPRLQRLSLGEVALLTSSEPAWSPPRIVAQTRTSVTVRWAPIQAAAAAPTSIRLLNAARRQGLAARTRTLLAERGWRRMEIGDATQIRWKSLLLYPRSQQAAGRRLAAHLGIASAVTSRGNQLVVLLGRDVAALRATRSRG